MGLRATHCSESLRSLTIVGTGPLQQQATTLALMQLQQQLLAVAVMMPVSPLLSRWSVVTTVGGAGRRDARLQLPSPLPPAPQAASPWRGSLSTRGWPSAGAVASCIYLRSLLAHPALCCSVPRGHTKLVSKQEQPETFDKTFLDTRGSESSSWKHPHYPQCDESTTLLDYRGCRRYHGRAVSHAHDGRQKSDRLLDTAVGIIWRRSRVGRSSTGISRDSSVIKRPAVSLHHESGMFSHQNMSTSL